MAESELIAVEGLLEELLPDQDVGVRRWAAGALGRRADARAVEPLIGVLEDEDPHVRKEAVIALGEIGDRRAVEPLIGALSDEDEDVREVAAIALRKIESGDRPPIRSAGRLLVVDAHPSVRQGLVRYFDQEGFEVVGTAGDGVKAVELAGNLRPDVVTMGIRMPVMDGLTALALIRGRYPDVQVVMLTPYDDEAFVQEAMVAGAAGYVVMGAPDDLVRVVRSAAAIGREAREASETAT